MMLVRDAYFNLKRVEGTANVFSRDKQKIISDARQFLQGRFENFSSPTLSAAAVLTDHNSWPRRREDVGLYGENDDVAFATHYRVILQRNGFDVNEAKDQWLALKLHAFNTRAMDNLTKQDFWKQIFSLHSEEY